jgi:methyl-accepting chemotaxis protein
MKLRNQVLSLGMAGAAAAAIAGAIALHTSDDLGDGIEGALGASNALQASQEADMMHDAIRGDAQLALLGAVDGDAAQIAEARAGLKEHAERFNTCLDDLLAATLTAESRSSALAARPLVARYIGAAEDVMVAAQGDRAASKAAAAQLQVAFVELEAVMEALSESIEANGTVLIGEAREGVSASKAMVIGAVFSSTVLTVLAALWLAKHITAPMTQAVSVANRMADGDLSMAITPSGNDETVQLLRSMAEMREKFSSIVRKVKSEAGEVAIASSEIAQGNQDLSQRTEEQAGALQQTAATMTLLSATVRTNADNAKQANQLALGASSVAARGGEVVGRVVGTMKSINDGSKRIADIIGVIDGIAFQTNILALNAAVEAARAGEQGRGFAVVASEVRSLARRSAEAATEIRALIGSSVEQVQAGTTLVDRAGQTMVEIVEAITRVSDIVAEISAASVEQSSGVTHVSQVIADLDQVTQQNSALVEENAAAAEGLKVQANHLVSAVATFKVDGDGRDLGSAAVVGLPHAQGGRLAHAA